MPVGHFFRVQLRQVMTSNSNTQQLPRQVQHGWTMAYGYPVSRANHTVPSPPTVICHNCILVNGHLLMWAGKDGSRWNIKLHNWDVINNIMLNSTPTCTSPCNQQQGYLGMLDSHNGRFPFWTGRWPIRQDEAFWFAMNFKAGNWCYSCSIHAPFMFRQRGKIYCLINRGPRRVMVRHDWWRSLRNALGFATSLTCQTKFQSQHSHSARHPTCHYAQ